MKNKKIFIYLILIAIFTVLSFLFDQLVIFSENKLRENNYKYQILFKNYNYSKLSASQTQDFLFRNRLKYNNFTDRKLLLDEIISIGILKKENISIEAKKLFITTYQLLAVQIKKEFRLQDSLLFGLNFKVNDKDKGKVGDAIMKNFVTTDQAEDLYISKINDKIINNNFSSITKLEKAKSFYEGFLNHYLKYQENFVTLNSYYINQMETSLLDLEKIIEKIDTNEKLKNRFILLSVLSQILSLLFLIFLFKLILPIKKN